MAFIPDTANKGPTPGFVPDAQPAPQKDFLSKATDVATSIFPGTRAIGEGLGTAALNIQRLFRGQNPDIPVDVPRMAGGVLQAGATVAGLGAPLPTSALRGAAGVLSRTGQAAATYGALGATQGLGQGLQEHDTAGQLAGRTGNSAAISAAAGGVFNLLGEGVAALAKKAGPSILSFTSGVPKEAISQAGANPEVAKKGLGMTLSQIHDEATGALGGLQTDLSTEFQTGLKKITEAPPTPLPPAQAIRDQLVTKADEFASQLRVPLIRKGQALTGEFGQSAIVKGGEQSVVNETLKTINTWNDFSPAGMQDLAERVGALRNFESGAKTQSSAIVGKIYNAIAGENGLIPTYYPELAKLRTNFSVNKDVLDGIENVLNATSEKPTQIQGAVSRLDSLFKDNREQYLNVIKELSRRSGVDIVSQLAGTEFQKVLPGFIRGLGGGGAVSVGASLINPWLLLLSPLFSPRFVGAVTRNAQGVGNTTAALTRLFTTSAAPQVVTPQQAP